MVMESKQSVQIVIQDNLFKVKKMGKVDYNIVKITSFKALFSAMRSKDRGSTLTKITFGKDNGKMAICKEWEDKSSPKTI